MSVAHLQRIRKIETELEWTVPHAGMETGPAPRLVVMATVSVAFRIESYGG
jgi:hypothetical protein